MIQVPDPSWKVWPDIVANESAEEYFVFDDEEDEDDE